MKKGEENTNECKKDSGPGELDWICADLTVDRRYLMLPALADHSQFYDVIYQLQSFKYAVIYRAG